jgi:hypothetical protein
MPMIAIKVDVHNLAVLDCLADLTDYLNEMGSQHNLPKPGIPLIQIHRVRRLVQLSHSSYRSTQVPVPSSYKVRCVSGVFWRDLYARTNGKVLFSEAWIKSMSLEQVAFVEKCLVLQLIATETLLRFRFIVFTSRLARKPMLSRWLCVWKA